jgi:hypothetical protein
MYALYQAASQPAEHGTPRDANNSSIDAIIRTYQGFTYGGGASQVCRDLGLDRAAEDFSAAAEVWHRRNRRMADTIKAVAVRHPGGRVVAVTGFWHRYALRDLLAGEPGIELREYYELPGNYAGRNGLTLRGPSSSTGSVAGSPAGSPNNLDRASGNKASPIAESKPNPTKPR